MHCHYYAFLLDLCCKDMQKFNMQWIFVTFFEKELLRVSVSLNFPFAVAGLSPLGTIVERRKRSPLADPVKNGASFNDF